MVMNIPLCVVCMYENTSLNLYNLYMGWFSIIWVFTASKFLFVNLNFWAQEGDTCTNSPCCRTALGATSAFLHTKGGGPGSQDILKIIWCLKCSN